MWNQGYHCKEAKKSFNDELLEIKGTLEEDAARVTFAKFLHHNPTFAAQILFGIELYPIQDLTIKSMFLKDFGLYVLSRGMSKTYSAAIFAALYALFNPGVKVAILAKTFRQSRFIFKHIEDFANSKRGIFFKQCMGKVLKNPDAWLMQIGRSTITALPLADGSRIRGYRFNLILIDEALLLSDQVVNEVIRPFLNVPIDPVVRQRYKEASELLIKKGELTVEEAEECKLPNQKLICLSSASYTFEYLYKMLKDYESKILTPKDKIGDQEVSHCIFQLSYKMAPEGLLSKQNIEEARAQMSDAQFGREYNAQFTDDSASYFSPRRMREATVLDGERPCTLIQGDKELEYVLAIDPNYSDSETSDHFAMCLLELNNKDRIATMVHGYALSKSNTVARAKYLSYLTEHFNIVYIIVDNAGGKKFIEDCNLMEFFEGKEILFHEADFSGPEEIKETKKQYNKDRRVIGHAQVFKSDWIRLANEHMQMCIEKKRLMFACEVLSEKDFDIQKNLKIPINVLHFESLDIDENDDQRNKLADFIEHQGYMIKLTKTECALIEVTTTSAGNQSFDLPSTLRKIETPDKPRKDSYTALLLANWGAKCYWTLLDTDVERSGFIPLSFS